MSRSNAVRHRCLRAAVVASLLAAGAAAPSAEAAVVSAGKAFRLTMTLTGAARTRLLLVSAQGQTLASAKVTTSSQKVSLASSKVSTVAGATLQLVSDTGSKGSGAYLGPVVIGWKGTKVTSAAKVATKLRKSSSKSISLGTVKLKMVTARQGYAVALKASKLADTTTKNLAKATRGRPVGVGTYGKTQTVSSGDFAVRTTAVGDPCSPAGTPTCGGDGTELAPTAGQPGQASAAGGDGTLGGDADDDGIPNAFDVNDDGDATVDSADSETPAPKVSADDGAAACAPVTFQIFTNFKSTNSRFAGTINAYGTGGFQANGERIAAAITDSMGMVFSRVPTICDEKVTRTYLKGNGAPYAPTEFTELTAVCSSGDYQWQIGKGTVCGNDPAVPAYAFGKPYTFSGTDLPSGQHTFTARLVTESGRSYEITASPGFVFVTHPLVTAYSRDGSSFTAVDFTRTTQSNGPTELAYDPVINLKSTDTLSLRIHRPQRLAFEGETAAFYDLGGFRYVPDITGAHIGACFAAQTTDSEMPTDRPVDSATRPTLTLVWAIGPKCFGQHPTNAQWVPGPSDIDIQVQPSGPGGNSAQKITLQLRSADWAGP